LPKVSIITAAYNHVQFIRQSVESVLNQTYKDFEHIVVDDGSTDGTAEILKTFGNRIKYIRQENRGTHAALNTGIREASGQYIAILDSDDAWLPHKLERQVSAFEQFPETGLVYSQAYIIDSEGKKEERVLGEPLDPECAFETLLRYNPIPALTAVIKRDCINKLGGFSETFTALSDWELWIRISTGWPIVFIPEPLAFYRDHGRNTTYRLLESGQLDRERLLMLRDTTAVESGKVSEIKRRRESLHATFAYTVVRQAYGFFYRRQYSRAVTYLLFALKLRPDLVKDVPAALRLDPTLLRNGRPLRLLANLVFGHRQG
jgi:glycosyltransferase involved in cell wall biosynthesis